METMQFLVATLTHWSSSALTHSSQGFQVMVVGSVALCWSDWGRRGQDTYQGRPQGWSTVN